MASRRLPKEVVARAKALAVPTERRPVAAAPAPKSPDKAADKSVRAKLVAHLKKLHPMD